MGSKDINLRIMTSNIWGDYFGNPVGPRENLLSDVYRRYLPDILGLQEYTKGWAESNLAKLISDQYSFVEVKIDGKQNYTPLLFAADKFKVVECGWQLYQNTPDASKGITWAVFEKMDSFCRFAACSTHLWWKIGPEHDLIRESNAKELLSLMKNIKEKYNIAVFAFGDFNCNLNSNPLNILKEGGYESAQQIAKHTSNVSSHHGDPVLDDNKISHGSKTNYDMRYSIDHILLNSIDANAVEFNVVEDQDALDATDHSPIYVDVVLK